MNNLSEDENLNQTPSLDEEKIEYGRRLKLILARDIPVNSYLHLKDINGIYYIFYVTEKAGNFVYVECVFGPPGTKSKRGLMQDGILALNQKVGIGIEEPPKEGEGEDGGVRIANSIDALKEIIVTKEGVRFLPNLPIVYNTPIQSFEVASIPPHSVAIEVDTISGKQYTIRVLTRDEQGNTYVMVEGNGSLNGVVGRLKSMVIGEGYRILIKDSNRRKYFSTSQVTEMKLRPFLSGRVEAVLAIQHRQGKTGPFDQ